MFAIIFLLTALICSVTADEKYTTKYDNVDFDEIVRSERLLQNYVNCLMDRGPCAPDAAELKRLLPDALETDCSKCSEAQQVGTKKVIKHLATNKKDWFSELEDKYDPDRTYLERHRSEWEAEGIKFD
ncbi:ejaculatory bulb-specific protein 3-like [Cylas formicarius]|uniref:Chemosensory protein 10 n=2 Tax=Neoptera TaxID=33340 RepID=A0A4Y5RDK4_NEZVI